MATWLDNTNIEKCYNEWKIGMAARNAGRALELNLLYGSGIYKDMDVASLYPETVLAARPIEKLHDFCLNNSILVEGGHKNGKYVVTFSKFGVPFTVTSDSYTDYIGMNSYTANMIINELTAIYKGPSFKVWANSFYGMSSGGRPTGKPFKNAVVEYCEEDVMATKEMIQSWANSNSSIKAVGEAELKRKLFGIDKVIFNNPATVVLWKDGTKTVVKCQDGDTFDKEKGLAMAICKKALGTNESHSNFNYIFKKWITED